jgi:hypothetical protein
MTRSYIEWCRLLNSLTRHAYNSRTPARYVYWMAHWDRLTRLLKQAGWKF